MLEKSLKPSIRFKGFTEDWEQCELSNKVSFYTGLTYSPNNVTDEYGTLVLRSSNVKNGEVILEDNVYVESDIVNSENVQEGDIIVVRKGAIKYQYQVLCPIDKRQGAALVPQYAANITPQEELDKLNAPNEMIFLKRERGAGRPTKKERRDIEKLLGL